MNTFELITLVANPDIETVDPEFDEFDWSEETEGFYPLPISPSIEPDMQDYQFRRLARWHDRTWSE
jgi:hypothetical protein